MSLGIGVAGTGFGASTIVPAFRRIPDVRVVAICGGSDTAKTRAIAEAHGIPVHDLGFGAMCGLAGVDLVAIASPHEFHSEMVHRAVAEQKHVLCEKPLALTADDVETLCAWNGRSDRLHLMNHQLRYHPCIREMRDRIRNGDIGRPYQVHVRYEGNRYVGANASRREWWFRSALGGGMILAMGPHLIDLVQFWFGNLFSAVQATAAKVLESVELADGRSVAVDAESAWTCAARLTDGTAVLLSCTAVSHRPMSLEAEVHGTDGNLRFRSPGHLELVRTRPGGHHVTALCPDAVYEPAEGTLFQHAFFRYASAIAEAIRSGSRQSVDDATDFADYAYKHRVMEAIRQSSAESRVVHMGPPEQMKTMASAAGARAVQGAEGASQATGESVSS